MRHRASDAAMAVAQQTAMGVERHLAAAAEIAGAHPRGTPRRVWQGQGPSSSMASVMVKLS
jgi:hypothetical protein